VFIPPSPQILREGVKIWSPPKEVHPKREIPFIGPNTPKLWGKKIPKWGPRKEKILN